MNNITVDLNGFVNHYVANHLRFLNQGFFEILEDLKDDGYINDEVYKRCRKKWLDKSGNFARALDDQMSQLDFTLKK